MHGLENTRKFIESSGATKCWGTLAASWLPGSSREPYLEVFSERKFKSSWQHKVMAKEKTLAVSGWSHRQSTGVTDSVSSPTRGQSGHGQRAPLTLHRHGNQTETLINVAMRSREWKHPRYIQAAGELEENVSEDGWRLTQWNQSFTVTRLPGHRLTDTWSHQGHSLEGLEKNACLWQEVLKNCLHRRGSGGWTRWC